jgi:hypothetical protein
MIPDNIQANIMKYLNNGVSGSSQPQKPVVSEIIYEQDYFFGITSNLYITEDKQYWVAGGFFKREQADTRVQVLGIMNVENAINGDEYEFITIPNYGSYSVANIWNIDRDEEGRFYGIISFNDTQRISHPFLVIFNDFLTDGIIQINKAYKLDDYTFIGPAGSNIPLRGNSTKKIEGTGKYIVYDYSFGYNSKNYYYFTIFDTDVNTGPKIEKVYTKIFNNVYAGINLYSVNAESETPYILLEYYDETELVDTSIVKKNYKVDKLILTTDNTEDLVVTINSTNLYTAPSGYTDKAPRYTSNEDNGYYAEAILVKETGNTQTLKYILVRADGSKIDIDFPSTFSLTNYSNINYSITNSFIILRLFGDTRISYVYKIDYTNNSLVFISNLDQVFPTGTI